MPAVAPRSDQAAGVPRRLFHYTLGFWKEPRLRQILAAAGHDLRLGRPGPEDGVVVWGRSPYAARGEAVAARTGARLIRLEDAFLRSVKPGRAGGRGPLGLLIDPHGVHFDAATPSLLERILARDPLDDASILQRAREGMARLQASDLSKYNNHDETLEPPPPGYVLVIDQTAGDASIAHGAASARSFREMLAVAQIENPGARILIKTHPETIAGARPGHYGPGNCDTRTEICDAPISPWKLLEGAIAVYTVSSQLGLEAIFAGHRPRVFGQPFYAGWGLTQDENPPPRRSRRLTRAQLFAAAYLIAPTWFDPCRQRICSFEEAVDQLEAETRAWREDRSGHVAVGMRLWKRRALQGFFGQDRPMRFAKTLEQGQRIAAETGRSLLIWGQSDAPALHVEDGFLRSRGLGAELTPPLSLVTDRQGLYYDPTRPSDLETLIAREPPPGGRARAERLIGAIRAASLSKYNIGAALPPLPDGPRILVPAQVEDDASLRLGAGKICTNQTLLAEVSAQNAAKTIIFKPHPDIEAGLRPGAVPPATALRYADLILHKSNPIAAIEAAEEIWTMTSTLGFEALLRGKRVTCLGAPFYAGWGLTRDLGAVPARRTARPDLAQLAHATLIAYPRYHDPISGLPCPPEVIVERLAANRLPGPRLGLRILAKLQGIFASYAWLWR